MDWSRDGPKEFASEMRDECDWDEMPQVGHVVTVGGLIKHVTEVRHDLWRPGEKPQVTVFLRRETGKDDDKITFRFPKKEAVQLIEYMAYIVAETDEDNRGYYNAADEGKLWDLIEKQARNRGLWPLTDEVTGRTSERGKKLG